MNTPTKITVSRIVSIVVMLLALVSIDIACFCDNNIANNIANLTLGNSRINLIYFIVCIVFILASITDWLDGYLARKNNQVTDLGKFLDPVADKMLVNSLIIYLLFPHAYVTYQVMWPWWSAVIIVVRDIVVDALRFIAANKKKVIAANYFGKAKTVLQMVAIPAMLLCNWPFYHITDKFDICLIFVYLATLVSLVSGIIYVIQNKSVFKESKIPELIQICKEKNITIGSVESITGGSFASQITACKGSSSAFKGSIISYATEIKESLVKVNKDIINKNTVVSKEVAEEMATKGREHLNVDYCVSCTGNAGPTVCEGDMPVGRVYISLANKYQVISTKELNLKGNRNDIQNKTVEEMIKIIFENIL